MDIEKIRYLILAIQRQGERSLVGYFKELGVTPSQAEVLRILQEESPLSLKELGERLVCETGSPSRLLATLVDKGYINSQEAENDRRIKKLTLTAKGKATALRIKEQEVLFYRGYTVKLSSKAAQDLVESLTVLVSEPQSLRALQLRGFTTKGTNYEI